MGEHKLSMCVLLFQSLNPIAWVNIPVFDFRSRLLMGEHKLSMYVLLLQSLNPIAWVNIPVFDFRSRLLMGEHKLSMWPVTADLQLWETGCYPLGKTGDKNSTHSPVITSEIYKGRVIVLKALVL